MKLRPCGTGRTDAELLAPAGDFETARAAFAAGADAVYCGLADFSARAFAKNLSLDELGGLLRYCRSGGTVGAADERVRAAMSPTRRRVYVTFNTVVDEDCLDDAINRLARLDDLRPDALIVQDLGIAKICRDHFPSLELHASTQLVAHNLEGVLALKELGFRRVVLARELSLAEIASIAQKCGARRLAADGRPELELECFVHGALCYSLSGLCLFGAMEKGRSGNRGKCPYCCRLAHETEAGGTALPFSMKDLRLGEDVRRLVDVGVSSLKIEGRMKSTLYVASVTAYYRQLLGARQGAGSGGASVVPCVTPGDLETVFSRRTTKLYFDGRSATDSPIDSGSLGHLGAEIGVVKRVTKDREGRSWLRFHTARALERHDGLQFEAMADGHHLGMGISEMRQAISRANVFEVAAGTDVEVLLPEPNGGVAARPDGDGGMRPKPADIAAALKSGMKIYCSMSNAVKRWFPEPSYRPSDYAGDIAVDVTVTLEPHALRVSAQVVGAGLSACETSIVCELAPAKNPDRTHDGIRKAFAKLGGTAYRLGKVTLVDANRLFAPMSLLNDLRRDLVERLDAAREQTRREKAERAWNDDVSAIWSASMVTAARRLKVRPGQLLPPGEWEEVIVAVNADTAETDVVALIGPGRRQSQFRLALPVYTAEPDFNRLRSAVKRFLRAGYTKWEAADLATLRLLRLLGVTDVTADWTLYAFNSRALASLASQGVTRVVASPENTRENLRYLAESGADVEFLAQQSTPLFVSLTRPAAKPEDLAVFRRDGLWVTTRPVPRTFDVPRGVSTRLDLSWDPL